MSSVTRTSAPAAEASFARSETFRTFALVFAMATPVLYVICDMMNWPLFTYHPGTNRLDLGFAPAVKNEGPAMYWYGWTASAALGALMFGLMAALLPERWSRLLWPVWVIPALAMTACVYLTLPWFRL